jgi:hypothetical protein
LRRIEGATEEPATIAALLRHQERCAGILPVCCEIGGEAREQRLRSTRKSFNLVEVDPPGRAGSQWIAVFSATQPVNALADRNVELVDGLKSVGKVGISFDP